MRVIRPAALHPAHRRRPLLMALTMLAAGFVAGQLALASPIVHATGALAGASAIGLGVGAAWLLRVVRPSRRRRLVDRMTRLLAATFDDDYTLILAPPLPVRDADRLDGLLVGPAGVRVLTVRDWEGRYRIRGRVWEFDARGRRGWIRCRTNPSFDAIALATGVRRWAEESGLGELPLRPAVVFPDARARLVLEEPEDEIITADNAPWWASSIGRVRRLDPARAATVISAVVEAAERTTAPRRAASTA